MTNMDPEKRPTIDQIANQSFLINPHNPITITAFNIAHQNSNKSLYETLLESSNNQNVHLNQNLNGSMIGNRQKKLCHMKSAPVRSASCIHSLFPKEKRNANENESARAKIIQERVKLSRAQRSHLRDSTNPLKMSQHFRKWNDI